MSELLQVCFTPVVLPFTLLLGAVFAYWTMFIIGAIGLDAFDLDLDFDADADIDVGDIDVGDIGGDVDADLGNGGASGSGYLVSLLRFFNVGDVPLMILVSIFAFAMWASTVLVNDYFNPDGPPFKFALALGLMVPNLILALLVTKLVSWPFRRLFKHANAGIAAPIKIVGKTCIVTTSTVTSTFGQAALQLPDEPTPVTLNVRTQDDVVLCKGDEAIITEHDEDKNTYAVVPFNL